jgi:hypothetical protein
MIERGEGTQPATDIQPGEVITKDDAMRAEATRSGESAGLSTADLAGRSRDANRDGVPDAAARPEPVGGTTTALTSTTATADEGAAPLFAAGDAEGYRTRWTEVQTGFVDDPRRTVEQADGLVAEVMKRLAEVFADERARLEEQWSKGQEADTEGLRMALRRYRSFFDRLLSV